MDPSTHDSSTSSNPPQRPAPPAKDASPPSSPRLPPGPLVDIQQLTDHALRFLSTASNETLGACLVGLGGVTYLVLGRVGLVLMGVVGGIVLHAQWENNIQEFFGDETARAGEEKRRKETSLDVLKRVLDLQAQKQKDSARRDDDLDVQLFSGKQLDYSSFQPETAEALDELTDAVIRDYVKSVLLLRHLWTAANVRPQMVVFAYCADRSRLSKRLSPDPYCLRSLRFQPPLAQTPRRFLPRILDQLLRHHHRFSQRAIRRRHCLAKHRCARGYTNIPKVKTGQQAFACTG